MTRSLPWNLGPLLAKYRSHVSGIKISSVLLFCFGYYIAVLISEHGYGSLAVPSPFWLPSPVFLCTLLLTPKKHWWVYLLLAWPIRLAAGAVPGTPYWFLLSTIANDSLKALFAAWLLHKLLPRPGHFDTLREFIIFLAVAAVATPFLSALAAAPERHAFGNAMWTAMYRWFFGDCVAQVVAAPALLLWCTRSYRNPNSRIQELILLSCILVVVLSDSFFIPLNSHSPMMLYAPIPFLIWAAVRLRPFGTANAVALMASFAMFSSVENMGAFAGRTPDDSVLSIQLFLLLVSVPLLSLAFLNAENQGTVDELKTLLSAAPIAILVAEDPDCLRVTANRAGYILHQAPIGANLSRTGAHAEDMHFRIMSDGIEVSPAQLPLHRAARGEFVSGECLTLRAADGTERHIVGNSAPLFGEDGKPRGAVGAFLDITDQKLAEEMLRESEERFRLVADTAPVLIWMADANKVRTFFNKGWCDFTGRTIDQELGNGWQSRVHPEDLERCRTTFSAAFESRTEYKMEYRLLRFDGEYRWVLAHGVPHYEGNGVFCGFIGSCIDIADRKLAEERQRELTGRLIRAQEHERARIARELHDDFGQRMALLQMEIEGLAKEVSESSTNARQQLLTTAGEAAQISSDLHELSHQLHPSKLALGLVIAVRGYCRDISMQHHRDIHFIHDDIPRRIPKEVNLCLYRIVQESLWNVVKYSGAPEATVELKTEDDYISVSIQDSGVGFDPESERGKGGLGLVSMSERVWQIGGTFSVRSEPSRGTRVYASVPWRRARTETKDKANKVGA